MGLHKRYCLYFQPTEDSFLFYFFFSIYEVVDSEYSTNIYKYLKISTGTAMRNPEMLKFVRLRDRYKTQKMCDKTILENSET